MKYIHRAVLSALVLFASLRAFAGFDEALKAYQGKDFVAAQAEARTAAAAGDPRASFLLGVMLQAGQGSAADPLQAVAAFEKAAQGGVAGAYSRLAQAYARGSGVARDRDRALAYARKSAQIGEPEGTFFLSILLTSEFLNYLDASGKPDQGRYWQLARRPLEERAVDSEARDALYFAAGKGLPMAVNSLALTFAASIGDDNRKRMMRLVDSLGNGALPVLQNYVKISRHMEALGESYTSPQLFADAQLTQTLSAMIKTCGLKGAGEEKPPMPKLVGIRITRPVSNAVYLPTRVAGYEKAYLLAGDWEEGWTYNGCDRTETVTVKFTADGLGGARIVSEQSVGGPAAADAANR